MGHVPLPPAARNAEQALAYYGPQWARHMRHRYSRLAWRRRRAYEACKAMIRAREACLGMIEDPWVLRPPPKPADLRRPPPPAPDIERR